MYKCCQFKRPCARMDKADLAHCASLVGLADTSNTRSSESSAESNRSVLCTPNTRKIGGMEDDVKDSTTDALLASKHVGNKYFVVST